MYAIPAKPLAATKDTRATKYFNSATPYLSNLSFWATQNFRGSVEEG